MSREKKVAPDVPKEGGTAESGRLPAVCSRIPPPPGRFGIPVGKDMRAAFSKSRTVVELARAPVMSQRLPACGKGKDPRLPAAFPEAPPR